MIARPRHLKNVRLLFGSACFGVSLNGFFSRVTENFWVVAEEMGIGS